MAFALIALAMSLIATVCQLVCVSNWRMLLSTRHASQLHRRANLRVEALQPLVVPLAIGALAVAGVGAAREHWSPVAVATVVLLCLTFVAQVLVPSKPCPRCKTDLWSRLGQKLLPRTSRSTSDA